MKTFAISLQKNKIRREYIIKHLNKLNLDYEIFNAIDGRNLTKEDIAKYCSTKIVKQYPSKDYNEGVIGCALSHYSIYKQILERKLKCAFVVEDDIVLPVNIKDILDELEQNIRKNEIILLYYFGTGSKSLRISVIGEQILKTGRLLYPIGLPYSASAYVIDSEAVLNLSKQYLPIWNAADGWHNFYNRNMFGSLRVLYPSTLKNVPLKSSIGHINKKNFLNRYRNIPLIRTILRIKRKNNMVNSRSKILLVSEESPIYKKLAYFTQIGRGVR
jgi:glycosyl transferase family 25